MLEAGAISKWAATFTLMIGLMYAQVCNVLCNLVEIPALVEVVQPLPSENASHCHHRESSDQSSQEKTPQPQSPADTHSCPSHDWVGSLPSEISKTGGALQQYLPQASAGPCGLSIYSTEYRPVDAVDGFHFHPPPQITQRSILRV
jgi:hypothetical protein